MKKIILSMTLLLIAALAISACSAATAVVPTATVGGALPTSTASASGTGTAAVPQTGPTTSATTAAPTSGATSAATTAATAAATTSATAAATSAATSSGVTAVATTVTNTPAAAATSAPVAAATGTPFAGVSGQFVRLSILLQSNMVSGSQSGQITGVVIAQPNPVSGATASPAGTQPVPYVRYVVVNTSASATPTPGSNEMLLPWQMFAFNPSTTSADGKVSQTFTLKGSAASRQNVPQVSLPNNSGVLSQGWDTQLSQYWASQGFAIPVTGNSAQQQETEVLLRQTVNGANIVDPKNQALGQVTDFLIDPNTGQFVYAVFNGGQMFGNRYFVIPVRNLIFQLSSATSSGLGSIQLTVPSTVLNAAPFITNPSQIPVDPNLLQQLNNFWQNLQK